MEGKTRKKLVEASRLKETVNNIRQRSLPDAPSDGNAYVRCNGKWERNVAQLSEEDKNRLKAVEDFIEQFPESGDEICAIVNRKAEIIGDADEDVLTQARATAQTLALDAVKQGVMPVIDDAELLEEVRQHINDDEVFAELMAKSVKTLELKPEPTYKEKMAMAVAEYKALRAQEAAEAEMMRQLHDGTIADTMIAGEHTEVSSDVSVKNVVKPDNTEYNGTEAKN